MPDTASEPRRRFLRFSLRTMLLLVLAITAPLGWTLHKVREQGRAVAALKKMGCSLDYRRVFLSFPGTRFRSPTVLERLREMLGEDQPRDVTQISAEGSQVSDEGLAYLRALPRLAYLSLNRTRVTDQGLPHLRGLNELTELDLDETRVTDKGLVNLQGLNNLHLLTLEGTQVTDSGLIHLSGLTLLRHLHLGGTQVTDAGLVHLRRLSNLCDLDLRGTRVTVAKLRELGKAMPGVVVRY